MITIPENTTPILVGHFYSIQRMSNNSIINAILKYGTKSNFTYTIGKQKLIVETASIYVAEEIPKKYQPIARNVTIHFIPKGTTYRHTQDYEFDFTGIEIFDKDSWTIA
jgi:hypothetical protein